MFLRGWVVGFFLAFLKSFKTPTGLVGVLHAHDRHQDDKHDEQRLQKRDLRQFPSSWRRGRGFGF